MAISEIKDFIRDVQTVVIGRDEIEFIDKHDLLIKKIPKTDVESYEFWYPLYVEGGSGNRKVTAKLKDQGSTSCIVGLEPRTILPPSPFAYDTYKTRKLECGDIVEKTY
jgi:hypothetical protein